MKITNSQLFYDYITKKGYEDLAIEFENCYPLAYSNKGHFFVHTACDHAHSSDNIDQIRSLLLAYQDLSLSDRLKNS